MHCYAHICCRFIVSILTNEVICILKIRLVLELGIGISVTSNLTFAIAGLTYILVQLLYRGRSDARAVFFRKCYGIVSEGIIVSSMNLHNSLSINIAAQGLESEYTRTMIPRTGFLLTCWK